VALAVWRGYALSIRNSRELHGDDPDCINTLRSEFTFKTHAQEVTVTIQQNIIDIVFEELKRIGQCTSRSQFSREWLGREESYYRSIQSKGLKPSAEAQLNLVSRLRDLGMNFSRSEYPTLVELGHTYLRLYGECLDALLTRPIHHGSAIFDG
jgi:hypothetical protein